MSLFLGDRSPSPDPEASVGVARSSSVVGWTFASLVGMSALSGSSMCEDNAKGVLIVSKCLSKALKIVQNLI